MSENFTKKLVYTEDGSATFYLEELNEHYHSTHGAIGESEHVFIKHGFLFQKDKFPLLNILEIGLGTGLNVFLTFLRSDKQKVNYLALEPFPLSLDEMRLLNYAQLLNANNFQNVFDSLHEIPFEISTQLREGFRFQKIKTGIENTSLNNSFNLVYFDAFAPDVQPELWTAENFSKIYEAMEVGGVLVTYSAKGIVKRALKSCGFKIESLPGAPGKREMTRAVK